MKSFFLTDIGSKRKANQDYVYSTDESVGILPNIYVVADGMGGHKAGDYASRVSTTTVVDFVKKNTEYVTPISVLEAAIQLANGIILKEAKSNSDYEGMGTTFVVATVLDKLMYVANVGDSRLYIINCEADKIKQITEDHSLVEEMVKKGELDRKEARFHPNKNIITRALGAHDNVDIDFYEIDVEKGDIILLCSDGLTNMVDDLEIKSIVISSKDNCEVAVEKLVEKANQYGGKDNISVILASI